MAVPELFVIRCLASTATSDYNISNQLSLRKFESYYSIDIFKIMSTEYIYHRKYFPKLIDNVFPHIITNGKCHQSQ